MKCANCGKIIENSYFIIGDNYLQIKFFDSEEDNVFCSKECICKYLSVIEIYLDSKE